MVKGARDENDLTDSQRGDVVIPVTLSRQDYDVMREMIERQKSLNWFGKYVRNVLFVFAGGILTLVAFGDQIKKLLSAWIS